MQCPNHQLAEKILLKIFHREFDKFNKTVVENAFIGSRVKFSYEVALNLLNQLMRLYRCFHARDAWLDIGTPSVYFCRLRTKEKEWGKRCKYGQGNNPTRSFPKHVMGSPLDVINAITSKSTMVYDNEEWEALDK